jgi:hypothetical protein
MWIVMPETIEIRFCGTGNGIVGVGNAAAKTI